MARAFIFSNHAITVSEPLTAQVVSPTEFIIKLSEGRVPQPIGKLVYDAQYDTFYLEDMIKNVHMRILVRPNWRPYTVHLLLSDKIRKPLMNMTQKRGSN